MSKEITIYCVNSGEYVKAEGGDTLAEIAERISKSATNAAPANVKETAPAGIKETAPGMPPRPICARVNNRTEDLCFPVFAPKQVEYLDTTHPSGRRVYVRSLCMMLYKAVRDTMHSMRLRFDHSIAKGIYCRLITPEGVSAPVDDSTVATLKTVMRALVERDIPFVRREKLTADVIEAFKAQDMPDKVALLESTHNLYTVYYSLDDVYDSYYGPLAPSTAYLPVFDLIPYKEGMLLLPPDERDAARPATPVKQEKMYEAFTDYLKFNRAIQVSNVGELNRVVEHRRTADLINVAETLHSKLLGKISDDITRRNHDGGARVVLIAGPSSSGKTTSCKRLAVHLMTNLLMPKMISLDDYFVDRAHTPLDDKGDYDYESLYALDLDRLNSDINRLLAGEEINLPTYSFELGRRVEKDRPLRLNPGEILIMEGIHGLNPELTAAIPADDIFKVYVSALTTLSIDDHNWIPTTDNRLLRRIVRDFKYRHTNALETIRRWPSVRAGEEKWIFPYQENADATFNSSLIFELGVMRDYAIPVLRQVPHDAVEYSEASRLERFLNYFEPIPAEQIPSTSLLREFLGGSSFKY
jgi:uridine kinase